MGNRQYVVRFDFIYKEDMEMALSKLSFYDIIDTEYNNESNMYTIYIGIDNENEIDKIRKIIDSYFNSIQA